MMSATDAFAYGDGADREIARPIEVFDLAAVFAKKHYRQALPKLHYPVEYSPADPCFATMAKAATI